MRRGRPLPGIGKRAFAGIIGFGALATVACSEPTPVRVRPPASLTKLQGDSQAVIAGQPVPIPLSVVVKDSSGQALGDVTVTFSITQGGGTIGSTTAKTSSGGTATAGTWTLGPQPGDNTLFASVTGVSAGVAFVALGVAAASAITAPDGQAFSGPTSQEISIRTLLTDASSQPVPNAAVRFALGAGTGSLAAALVQSNASGIATGRFTPTATPGQSTITATLVGTTGAGGSLTFSVTTYTGLSLAAVGSTSLTALRGETRELVVRLRDGSSQPVPNATVTFQTATGHGLFGSASAFAIKTDAAGEARANWTMPANSGSFAAGASAFGQIVGFAATVNDPPYVLAYGTHSQFAPAGEFAIFNLEARGISNGFIDSSRAITYQIMSGGGVLRDVPPTNADYTYGQVIVVTSTRQQDARAQVRLGPLAGANKVIVSSPGYAPDSFTVNATRLTDCADITTVSASDSINPTLSSIDCPEFYRGNSARWYTKPYRMTLGATTLLRVSLNFLTAGTGSDIILMNENHYLARRISSSQGSLRLLAAPGTLYLGASTNTVSRTGSFTLASYPLIPSPLRTGDFIMRGVDANLTIDGSVGEASPPFRASGGKIYLVAGVPVTIEVQSTAFDPFVAIRDAERTNSSAPGSVVLASDDNSGGGTTARLVWTAPRSGLYEIWLGTAKNTDPTGSYRLIVQ